MKEKRERNRQYHSFVCAGLRIALDEDSAYLSFEEEHQLGTGSKAIDFLIIKKSNQIRLKKNIGHIFRGHNLVEIKGYGDYLSIDKFYKSLGYAFFYKADTGRENSINIQDITITFICCEMPKKLLAHLKKVWEISHFEKEEGIYYLEGFVIPIQILVASRLDEEENLLLKSILTPVKDKEKINKLLKMYRQHEKNGYYERVMDFIIQKDQKDIRREENMGPEMRKFFREMASEMATEMATEMASEMATEMADKMANEIANKMLKDGLPLESVVKYTGFPAQKVEELQKRIV